MEGSRVRGRRLLGHAARRVAGSGRDRSPSPRRRRGRRLRRAPVDYRLVRPRLTEGWEDAPQFEFLGTVRNPRRRRSPTPPSPPPPPPDPDDDPAAVNILAALPLAPRLSRRERMNKDIQFSGTFSNVGNSWGVPIPTMVGIARGANYAERATSFVRVERLGFKILLYQLTGGAEVDMTVPPIPDSIYRWNNFIFRFSVIYDKQSDGVDPTGVNPDVYAFGSTYAFMNYRLPSQSQRFEVLYDRTFDIRNGEFAVGVVEVATVGVPFFIQSGLCAQMEFFIDCDKIVRYSGDGSTASSIASGNIYYMWSGFGVTSCAAIVNSRTTFSDTL